jgi:ABC-type antimicrobial peptide transport system permease subunit
VRTLEQMLETEAFDRATMTALLNTFAFVGLILAALGVYGVIRHAVEHRTHEIAVRMGLGARAAGVVRMIVAQGARGASHAFSRWMRFERIESLRVSSTS